MLKLTTSLLICAVLTFAGASAEEATDTDAADTEDTRAIKVKTRTQKLSDACGIFDEARQACKDLRTACKKAVNSEKPECTALPAEQSARADGVVLTD